MRLKDKKALVTGGAGAIGRAICLGLASEGSDVAVCYHNSGRKAESVAQQISQQAATKRMQ